MIKSICIETIFTEVPFEERFFHVKEAGFDYIEFWSWDDKNIEKIKELCKRYDLKIASFSGDKDYSLVDETQAKDYINFIEKSIETAKYLECNNLVIHSNALGDGGIVLNDYADISYSKKILSMYQTLKESALLAEKEKVNLVLEALNTHLDHVGNFLDRTEVAAELIQKVNSSYVKVLYDAYHMQIMEGNIIDTLKRYRDVIGYIHIADVPGRHEPGTGEINYKNVLKVLKELKYDSFIGFELFPLNSSREAVEVIKDL